MAVTARRQLRPEVIQLLDLLDRLVASGAAHLPPDRLNPLAVTAKRLRHRRAYSGVSALVGLAGGTGSGKSSLLNALMGEEVSDPGATRPTTSRPLVVVPTPIAERLERMWSALGIDEVVERDTPEQLTFIDMPDLDSVAPQHRRAVEELLAILDVVVWVTDPEKYRDRVLHDQFLRPLTAHEGSFLFVLNQVDRLDDADVELVTQDLEWALRHDGFADPTVVATAADPPAGPPDGIDELLAIMVEKAAVGAGERRIRIEIKRVLDLIAPSLAPVGFAERWEIVRKHASSEWPQSPPAARQRLADFVEAITAEAPELTVSIDVISEPAGDVDRHLDATLGRALREGLRPRAQSRAIATELELALSD